MTEEQFDLSTPRQLFNRLRGWNRTEEMRQRQEWERTRWQTWILVNMQTKKEVSQKALITFPWEKSETKRFTDEELKAHREKMLKDYMRKRKLKQDNGDNS